MGKPEKVADQIEEWFKAQATDGFIIIANISHFLGDFVEDVVPILQERGLFRKTYEADTLRENLGMKMPTNRYVRDSVEHV